MQTVAGANGTTFAPTLPVGTVAGDLLVAIFYTDAAGTVTMPSGFTNLYNVNPSGSMHLRVDWKIAVGSDATSWSWTGSVWRVGALLRITGAQSSGTPYENNASAQNTTSVASTNSSLPSVALTGAASVDDLALIATAVTNDNAPTWSAPSTWTIQWNSGDDIGIAKQTLASGAAAPASTHVTISDSNAVAGPGGTVILAIKSPSGAPSPQTVTPGFISTAESVYQPNVKLQVLPNAIGTAESVAQPTALLQVLPNAITTAEGVYGPVVTLSGGAQSVVPNVVASAENVFGPTVTQQVLPDTIATSALVRNAMVMLVIPQTVNPAAISSAEQVYPPSFVGFGVPEIHPDSIPSAASVYAPTVSVVPRSIAPPLLVGLGLSAPVLILAVAGGAPALVSGPVSGAPSLVLVP
jgi:hypothetical protein